MRFSRMSQGFKRKMQEFIKSIKDTGNLTPPAQEISLPEESDDEEKKFEVPLTPI